MSQSDPKLSEMLSFAGVNTLLTIAFCAQFFGGGIVLSALVSWVQ